VLLTPVAVAVLTMVAIPVVMELGAQAVAVQEIHTVLALQEQQTAAVVAVQAAIRDQILAQVVMVVQVLLF
jgi:hypothetical protein